MSTPQWLEIRIEIPERIQEEVSLFLTEWSGRGVILEDDPLASRPAARMGIKVYFPAEEFGPLQEMELQQYLQRLESHGYQIGPVVRRYLVEEDWAHAWQAHFKPRKLTRRIVIRPPWEDYQPAPEEIVLTIYPGMAFGTGRHPTTRLCLQALEEILEQWPSPGTPGWWQALDVGTGTGILALAAARFGARVLAIDIDPEAVAATRKNILLNQLQDRVRAEDLTLDSIRQRFGLILANLTAVDLQSLAESLAGRVQPGGWLIVSGFLQDDVPRLLTHFATQGLALTHTYSQEDWVALVFNRYYY
ncbi:MAG: 50S ribosomal protein L11 methyltransferase [Deltaproteobacteria bacterium]|nr:50S ribosomal protein L11 methyltransferase [Deltaproteobacteria bacterium]